MNFIDEIKSYVQDLDFGSRVFFSDPKYECFEIDGNKFVEIKSSDLTSTLSSEFSKYPACIFIDGGNAEIILSPGFSVSLIRLGAVAYNGRKKLFAKRSQHYCLVKSVIEDGKIFYNAKLVVDDSSSKGLLDNDEMKIDSMDGTIREGIHRGSISKVAGIVRRLAELKLAIELCSENENAIIVLDGSLQASSSRECECLDVLYGIAKKNFCNVIGLCKTNTLLTEKGFPVSFALENKAKSRHVGKWCYKVASSKNKDHIADIYFAKLHEKSSRAFRMDVFNGIEINDNINSIMESLSANSVDATFLGYPYGLVEADKIARVSNSESEILKTRTKAKLGDRKS